MTPAKNVRILLTNFWSKPMKRGFQPPSISLDSKTVSLRVICLTTSIQTQLTSFPAKRTVRGAPTPMTVKCAGTT